MKPQANADLLSRWTLVLALTLATLGGMTAGAAARTLSVGANQELKMPSAAAAIAKDGDTVLIEPGEYFDCAVWSASKLTIEGKGPGVVITDKSCQGKALFVVNGNDITIRNITFTRARVPDGNGAGIRAEGVNLTIERSKFLNNENGILAAPSPTGFIRIIESEFDRNGKCPPTTACAHGIYVNALALLKIEKCIFRNTREGHQVKSRAARTEVTGSEFSDGESGTSSYLLETPNGGTLVVRDNVFQKGPQSSNRGTAISIGAEGVDNRTTEIIIANNTFTNDNPNQTVFVRNLTATDAVLQGNKFSGKGKITPLVGDGSVR